MIFKTPPMSYRTQLRTQHAAQQEADTAVAKIDISFFRFFVKLEPATEVEDALGHFAEEEF